MSIRVGVRDFLRHCGHALTNTVHERFDALERRMDRLEPFITDAQTSLVQASIHIIENLHALAGRAVIETGDANGAGSAERALAAFLYSYVPNRAAIEIGELNLALSEAGFEVHAIGMGHGAAALSANGLANSAGVSDARAVAAVSTSAREVEAESTIPGAIGMLAIGGDAISTLRESGDFGAAVLAANLENFAELVADLRGRGYHWHVAIYRSPVRDGASYFANFPRGVPEASGSAFFFRDYRAFSEAQAWCAATLPRTYFKPPPD